MTGLLAKFDDTRDRLADRTRQLKQAPPGWLRRPKFLTAGAMAAFVASWAGAQSSTAHYYFDQWERSQLNKTLAIFNQPTRNNDPRWAAIIDQRWAFLERSTRGMAQAASTGIVKFSDLPFEPRQSIAILKQLDGVRWLQVDIGNQQLTAWVGNKPVRTDAVSTGKSRTPTRPGTWTIYTKLRTTRMRGPGYDVPNVPYTMYYDGGYGIHGAYWHNNFGTPMSHGCTNLPIPTARWYFNWAEVGTPVVVHR
jgi:lipoprotein-anchoring transpeptidase ErfK/SrfK